jgi:Trk-type K+ transport system membrane component
LICIIEHDPLSTQAPGYSLFSVLFEVTSAYGTVGLSLGVPYDHYSFSGTWHVLSKLVLLTVMLRGRHRILPMAVDRAVLVPGQELMQKLDREYSGNASGERNWRDVEERIFEEERGGQVEEEKSE